VGAGVSAYVHDDPGGEVTVLYKVRHVYIGPTHGPFSPEAVRWVGPDAPNATFYSPQPEHIGMFGTAQDPPWLWDPGTGDEPPALEAELWLDTGIIPEATGAVTGGAFSVESDQGAPGSYDCSARIKATSYGGVEDFSDYTAVVVVNA
jgi:hypothetical protein